MVYLGLGSNLPSPLGQPEDHLAAALEQLATWPGVVVEAVSSLFRTQPQERPDQPWYANQVARLRVAPEWTPERLLATLKAAEQAMGRQPGVRYGPRVIDLDILLFEDRVVNTPQLTVPHPRLTQRAFVLVPLLELEPELILPNGVPAAEVLKNISYRRENNVLWQP